MRNLRNAQPSPVAGPMSPELLLAAGSRAIDRLARIFELSRYFLLAFATAGYFINTSYRAQRRQLWFDEIFTLYISRLPDLHSVWAACTSGTDFNPPLVYLMSRWSQSLLGPTELGLRMPEIIGFWVFCLCLYRFVSVRTSALAGLIAMLYPLTTGGYWYASEARPHGLIVGFFGVALVCWQALGDEPKRRWIALAGLASALTCASLSHCFAFLAFIPLGIGELVRTIQRRHIDVGVWGALLAPAAVSVAVVLPLISTITRTFKTGDFATSGDSIRGAWLLSFMTPLFALTPLLALLAASTAFPQIAEDASDDRKRTFKWDETAVLIALCCTPLFAFGVARLGHSLLFARYSLITVAGVACLIGAAAARRTFIGFLVLALIVYALYDSQVTFTASNTAQEPSAGIQIDTRPDAGTAAFDWTRRAAEGNDPIVVEPFRFIPKFYYAPDALRWRYVFLTPHLLVEGYQRLQKCCAAPGTVSTLNDFVAAHRGFYVFGTDHWSAEMADVFRAQGATIGETACSSREGESCVVRVDYPPR